ncbi:SusC/RagA family TonB-linked outer membrane protein [Cellulophaga lytica]|uniref:SusC/RagA family TonB-linked outer membrane protein n=1 Tax=Cellulophaga lytica TaxID=979 RepID=UPI000B75CD20|nr:SusC/RagA family TonB-linked outer membrane protein [Cellulophaga lytica]SNQ42780.1 TonB-dependent Transducer [Cellulophaga lytica]
MKSNLQKKLMKKLKTYIKLYFVISLVLTSNIVLGFNQPEKISVILNKVSLDKVFKAIENKTEYTFVYDNSIVKSTTKKNYNYTNTTLKEILAKLSDEEKIAFKVINKTITVAKKTKQLKTIKGIVIDKDNIPLAGASVLIKGAKTGTTTDFDGKFSLDINVQATTLIVNYMGFESKEITTDNRSFYQIILEENVNALNEVVVTALGIKREEKKLGYAQQTVKGEQLTDARPNNWSDALRGKVPGLNIQSLGGPLNSQEIKLRGDSSLNPGNNAALVVVDGVPVTSGLASTGASNSYMGGDASNDTPVDLGNGISDLNPEDIESVSVLKGAGAAALYGSRAANGVVIITTKSGKKQQGLGITYSSNTKFDVVTRYPDYQYEYGQGSGKGSYLKPDGSTYYTYGASEDGKSTAGSSSAFGPKFEGQYYFQYDPTVEGQSLERQLWQPYKNNRSDFWRVGSTLTQNLAIQGGNDKGSMRASLTHSKNEWIMPNTGFDQLSISVNSKYQITDNVKISSVVNYRDRNSDNLPGTGYNNHSIAYFMIFQNPNVNLDWYRPIWKKDKEGLSMIRPYSSYIDNPYGIAYEVENTLEHDAVTGNIRADINLTPKLDLMLRTSLNSYIKNAEQRRPYDINRYKTGYYKTTSIFKREVNSDFLLTYNNNIKNIDLNASVGANAMVYKYNRLDSWTVGLETPGIYNLVNGTNLFTNEYEGNEKVNSLYGMLSLGFNNKLFLDITGRNDWSSTLPKENWSFFYPSANASILLNEIFTLPVAIDFAKLRFSYAKVGNDAPRYSTKKYFGRSGYEFASSAVAPTTLYNTELKPEQTTSYEAGLDLRLLKNRLSLDAAVYETFTDNQILKVPLAQSSGYSYAWINSGEVRNRGVELSLKATPVKTKNFNWNTTMTWSTNKSKVMSLDDRLEGKLQMMSSSNARLVAKEGESATALYGRGFERNENGDILYTDNGYPIKTDDDIYIGETTPDWRAGFINSFKYKNLRLNMVIDGQYGGVIYSHTHHKLTQQGKLKHTLRGREEGELIGKGVVDNGDGTYRPNTTPLPIAVYYDKHYERVNTEANSFDASFVKLREVSLEYKVPAKFLKSLFISSASCSVYGRNLGVWTDFPIYDPEVAAQAGGTNIFTGVEVGQLPVATEFGFNVKLGL